MRKKDAEEGGDKVPSVNDTAPWINLANIFEFILNLTDVTEVNYDKTVLITE